MIEILVSIGVIGFLMLFGGAFVLFMMAGIIDEISGKEDDE